MMQGSRRDAPLISSTIPADSIQLHPLRWIFFESMQKYLYPVLRSSLWVTPLAQQDADIYFHPEA